ncbi:ATP-grasp domain-containing protein [Roseateles sp. DAIF2]|uniref:ATP-grasp domain-containing protein n=1 Tax=Roseateles sp. DAIF2 TaxID=2714952 RepID=UPI0018A26F72|nr:ATP-grasp domain-containing protein [Roseateles sp. DAIF2]QPF74103.1 ATP-grasp domain-containing protein [Roseateles sp. DAIF2]
MSAGPHCLALIGAIPTGTSQTLARSALARGWRVLLLGRPQDGLRGAFDPAVEVLDIAPTHEALLAQLRHHAAGAPLLLANANDKYARQSAAAAATLGLPGPDPAAIEAVADKAAQKRRLREAGLPVGAAVEIPAGADAAARRAALAGLRYPVVVKPAEGISSLGVRRCADAEEALAQLALLAADFVGERRWSLSGTALVEEFLTGPEYCVELFDGRYVGALRKLKRHGEDFVERGYSAELDLAPALLDALAEAAERAAAAAGLGWGPLHLDVILVGERPHIIDINPRIAGSFICELVRDAYGFDLVEALLAKLQGQVLPAAPARRAPRAYARVDFLLEGDPEGWDCAAPQQLQLPGLRLRLGPQRIASRERRAYLYLTLEPA